MADWQDNVLQRLRETERRRQASRSRRHVYVLHISGNVDFGVLVTAAAKKAGYNKAAFIRRSVAVQVARVLGLDVREVLMHCPSPVGTGKGGRWDGSTDDGTGIEDFQTV